MGQAHTIQQLLSKVDTFELGFDLAKQTFDQEDVRNELTEWFLKMCTRVPNKDTLTYALASSSLFGRVARFLQLMNIVDNDGKRIEDIGNFTAFSGHSGPRFRDISQYPINHR